jgi:hypothetical protein
MAPNDTTPDLATRLLEHADNITNAAAYELENDLRLAAATISQLDTPTPIIPALVASIRRAAQDTNDASTAAMLRAMIGE